MRRICVLAAASVAALWTSAASATEVQLRGGWASSLEEFPFARVDGGAEVNTDYGTGAFGEADVHVGGLFGMIGIEAGADFVLLNNDDSFGEEEPDGILCSTETFLGLIADCHDRVDLEADTRVITADILATKEILGLRLAFGATGLFLESELDADQIFPGGFESFVDRDTSLDAYGVKAGIEHSLPLVNTGLSLHGELYGSWVWGERTVDIFDDRFQGGASFQQESLIIEDTIDVPILDAALSLSWKVSDMTSLEVGGKYRRLFGAMFTSQTDGEDVAGSDSADLDYWTVFGGLTFML